MRAKTRLPGGYMHEKYDNYNFRLGIVFSLKLSLKKILRDLLHIKKCYNIKKNLKGSSSH